MDVELHYAEKQILLFDGVLNLLQEGRSIHELKVAEITEASGMGKSTAYEYFGSKEEIIREALTYHLRKSLGSMVKQVLQSECLEEMLWNAVDYLEESLEKRVTGIFLLLLTEDPTKAGTGHYLDPMMKKEIDQLIAKELDKVLLSGRREGSISSEITLEDLRMTVLGFFSAYVHEILPLKPLCCKEKRKVKQGEAKEEILLLKKRTVYLIKKTLA
jgi:AcrR family transcriptional regulator